MDGIYNIRMVLFFAIAILVAVLFSKIIGSSSGKYKKKELMTENEKEFFGRLISALPRHFVFPQVAMSAIIEPTSRSDSEKNKDRLRIAQQRVDYLVCDSTCRILVVIELDDKTHNKKKDKIRDERLLQSKVPTIRFDSRNKPSLSEIAAAIAKIENAVESISVIRTA